MPSGLITSSFGRQFYVETTEGKYLAVTKAKKNEYVVGDSVELNILNSQQAQIISLIPRKNLIYRSDNNRSKIIASNLDQLIIVIAIKPHFNQQFLDSCLICAESSNIQALIVINKSDLNESAEFTKHIVQLYQQQLNYQILSLNATDNCLELLPYLQNKRSLLIGQSGVGKSTITNQICPHAQAKIGEISKAQTSGCHTTTNANLYHINPSSDLIDCPGLQEFGLFHIELSQLAAYFPEMVACLGKCKFNNCRHLEEPQCAIREALNQQLINPARYQFYLRLAKLLITKKHY